MWGARGKCEATGENVHLQGKKGTSIVLCSPHLSFSEKLVWSQEYKETFPSFMYQGSSSHGIPAWGVFGLVGRDHARSCPIGRIVTEWRVRSCHFRATSVEHISEGWCAQWDPLPKSNRKGMAHWTMSVPGYLPSESLTDIVASVSERWCARG